MIGSASINSDNVGPWEIEPFVPGKFAIFKENFEIILTFGSSLRQQGIFTIKVDYLFKSLFEVCEGDCWCVGRNVTGSSLGKFVGIFIASNAEMGRDPVKLPYIGWVVG